MTDGPSQAKKKRTVKLFWKELKQLDGSVGPGRFGRATLWASLQSVEVNTAKLEHLFESRAKEVPASKVPAGWHHQLGGLWGTVGSPGAAGHAPSP